MILIYDGNSNWFQCVENDLSFYKSNICKGGWMAIKYDSAQNNYYKMAGNTEWVLFDTLNLPE